MRTVSLELARKLKEAGLQHQITYGDWYLAWLPTEEIYLQKPVLYDYTACGPYEEDIWLPTLADLLEWLEWRGYEWTMYTTEYSDDGINYKRGYAFQLEQTCLTEPFVANTYEDTAAQAILWVLEQEAATMGQR